MTVAWTLPLRNGRDNNTADRIMLDGVAWSTETNGAALVAWEGEREMRVTVSTTDRRDLIASFLIESTKGEPVDVEAFRAVVTRAAESIEDDCEECDGTGDDEQADGDCPCRNCRCSYCRGTGVNDEIAYMTIDGRPFDAKLLLACLNAVGARKGVALLTMHPHDDPPGSGRLTLGGPGWAVALMGTSPCGVDIDHVPAWLTRAT